MCKCLVHFLQISLFRHQTWSLGFLTCLLFIFKTAIRCAIRVCFHCDGDLGSESTNQMVPLDLGCSPLLSELPPAWRPWQQNQWDFQLSPRPLQLVGRAVRATADSGCNLLLSSLPEPSCLVTQLPSESSHETIWVHLAPSTTTQELRRTLNTLYFSKRAESHWGGDEPLTPPLSINSVKLVGWPRATP